MPTATIADHRERMLRLLEHGRSYEFLTMEAAYRDACPDDDFIRLMAAREYLKLGLVAPAHDLLTMPAPTEASSAEWTALAATLATMPSGVVPWASRRSVLDANLRALAARGTDIASIRTAWATQQNAFELLRDRHGVEQVRRRDRAGHWQWIPFLGDHRAVDDARAMPDGVDQPMPGPYLFDGLDRGWYFERVYRATDDTFLGYSCALFVVEPDPARLALVLHLRDWHDILADPRVMVFVGDACMDDLRRAWDDSPDLPHPRQVFRLGPPRPASAPSIVEVVQDAARRREDAVRASYRDIVSRYAGRDRRYWAQRFDDALSGRGAPLRVLAAVSTHTTFLQHAMRDARHALEALGHKCRILTEDTCYTTISPLTYHAAMRDLDPDLFLSIDHLRPEFPWVVPPNLPILSWDQDQLPHVVTESNIAGMAEHDFVVGCSKNPFVRAGCNPTQYLHALVPTCPERFGGDPLTNNERATYACDVSYVSHASQTPRAFHEHERAQYGNATIGRLLDAMYDTLPAMLAKHRTVCGKLPAVVLDEASRRCGVVVRDAALRTRLMWWYLWRVGDRMFRHEALEWVGAWARKTGRRFRIYGHGWHDHPTLAPFAAGPADNGRELLCIYRASRINLQLMPAGFIHQRALDGLA
ncbi:MAG: hypothetical protein ACE5E6_11425, partial [Phycisphaerae bacterium]